MAALDLSPGTKLARATAVRAQVDAAALPGRLLLFNTPRPAPGVSATPVVSITLTKPSGTVTDAGFVITQQEPAQVLNAADGISWGRIVDGNGNYVLDADAGLAAGSPPIVLDKTSVLAGGFVSLTSAFLAEV